MSDDTTPNGQMPGDDGRGANAAAESGDGAGKQAPTRREMRAAERTRQIAAAEAALRASQTGAIETEGAAATGSHVAGQAPAVTEPVTPDAPGAATFDPMTEADDTPLDGPSTLTEGAAHPSASQRREPDPNDPLGNLLPPESVGAGGKYPRAKRSKKGLIGFIIALVVVVGIGAIGWSLLGDRISSFVASQNNDFEGEGNGQEVLFSVVDGDTGTAIGERLQEAGVVKSSEAFIDEVLSHADEPVFQPGAYQMQQEMSAEAALNALMNPDNRVENTVVVPEGSTEADIFSLIEEATDITAEQLEAEATNPQKYGLPSEATSLEGFLFPATYTFEDGASAESVITQMVDRMNTALNEHGITEDQRWDKVRLASLIQKEAGLAADYPKVSRVFLNRLDQGMLLQSDATVAYGTGNTHRVSTTDAERNDAGNPYNTYQHEGMVAAPISNPGDLALDAAMHPADGSWLYFVTWNLDTGETIFSTTIEEHDAAVQKWLAWMDEHPEYE